MRNGLLLAAFAMLVLAAPARADSIVYANDGHLYLAYPEGTQQTRLTTDEPLYGSPSVADDGTIAAVWGGGDVPTFYFRTFDRTGKKLTDVETPRANANFFGPYWARISPDGTKIAFEMSYQHTQDLPGCPLTPTECQNKTWVTFTAVAEVGKATPLKQIAFLKHWMQPTWIDNDRLLVTDDSGSDRAGVATIGSGGTTVNPWPINGAMSFYGGEVNRQLSRMALRTDGGSRITVWNLAGGAGSAPSWCLQLQGASGTFEQISWSPAGDALAWLENDGIYTYVPGACTGGGTVNRPIASDDVYDPYWGPGDIPGKPRPVVTPTPTPQPPPPPTPTPTPQPRQPAAPTLGTAGKLPKLKKLGKSLAVRVTCDGACSLTVTATIAKSLAKRLRTKRAIATARATGSSTVKLTLPRKVAKALGKQKRVTVAVRANGTNSLGAAVSASTTLRLKR